MSKECDELGILMCACLWMLTVEFFEFSVTIVSVFYGNHRFKGPSQLHYQLHHSYKILKLRIMKERQSLLQNMEPTTLLQPVMDITVQVCFETVILTIVLTHIVGLHFP